MLNRIIIMGRLTRDPELRHTPNGIPVASFSLAVDRDYKNKNTGEKETDFIDVVAWRHTGEFVSRYFSKGRMAVVEGRLQMRDWLDKDQNKRRSAEIIADSVYFGDSKRDGDNTYATGFAPPAQANYGATPAQPSYQAPQNEAPPPGGAYPSYSPPSTGPTLDEFSALAEDTGNLPF